MQRKSAGLALQVWVWEFLSKHHYYAVEFGSHLHPLKATDHCSLPGNVVFCTANVLPFRCYASFYIALGSLGIKRKVITQ